MGRRLRRATQRAIVVALPLVTAMLVVPAANAGATTLVRPDALAPGPLPAGLHSLGALPGGHSLSLDVVLAPADPGRLSSLLDQLYDPSSPQYHQWLAPGAFSTQFAPAAGVRSAVVDWLSGLGLHPGRSSAFTVSARGTAAQVSGGLGVSVDRYRAQGGSVVYASKQTPEVPAALVGKVAAIVGLSNAPLERPLFSPSSGSSAAASSAGAETAQVGDADHRLFVGELAGFDGQRVHGQRRGQPLRDQHPDRRRGQRHRPEDRRVRAGVRPRRRT